jgi:hypothetical protein
MHRSSLLGAVLMLSLAQTSIAQQFGGSLPWGLEKPVRFTGEIRRGEAFSKQIGDGLSFTLTPYDGYWQAGVSGSGHDYSDCATPPLHGANPKHVMAWHFRDGAAGVIGGLGQKRWIDFVLNDEDNRVQCEQVQPALHGKNTFDNRISGRCWFTPLAVKLSADPPDRQAIDEMRFEGECALHGALELWRLPTTYTIDRDFTGWVTICFEARGQPGLPRAGDRYQLQVSRSPNVNTSSELRRDLRGARFEFGDGAAIPTDGPRQRIWGWASGYATCGPFQSFFVGGRSQYRSSAANPMLK